MSYDATNRRTYVDRTDPANPIGIRFDEIRLALGEVIGAELSRSDNINKWAKHKFMPAGGLLGYTEAEAKAINYGLHVPYYTSVSEMVKDVRQGTWTRATNYDSAKTPFQLLKLGVNNTARVLDMDNYYGVAPQPIGQLQAHQTNVPPTESPGFYASLGAYLADFIVASDLGFEVNGTDRRNLVIGFLACDGTGISSVDLSDSRNVFSMKGSASLLNEYVSRAVGTDQKYPFTRDNAAPHTVPACMFLAWKSSDSAMSIDMSSQGLFIPLTFTRQQFSITFETFLGNITYDHVLTWETSPTDVHYLATVIELMPNATCNGRFRIRCYKRNDELWVDTGSEANIELPLPKFSSDAGGGEVQWPVFVKFWTEPDSVGAGFQVAAESYLPALGTTIADIYAGVDANGDPLVPEGSAVSPITSACSLYNGADASDMASILIDSQLGTSALGYDQQTQVDIDPTL